MAEAIGRLVILIGTIEHELEALITAMFRVAPVLRPALSAGMALRPKIELIRTGIALAGPFVEEQAARRYFKALDDFARHGTRNFVYHAIVVQAPETGQFTAGIIRGGKRPHMKIVRLTKEYLDGEIAQLYKLRARIREMRIELTDAFNEFEKAWRKRQREAENTSAG